MVTKSSLQLKWWIAVLFVAAVAIYLMRQGDSSVAEFLSRYGTLSSLQRDTSREITPVLFVPLGAMLVVFVRRTLGLRVMGPFRSILLAVAFQVTGIVVGIAFLAFTVLCVSAIRPAARRAGLGYYGRITVMLSSVAVMMACAVMLGRAWDWKSVERVAHFPIVVLCLVADAFSRTKEKEGVHSAVWRVMVTGIVALPLAYLPDYPVVVRVLLRHPELLLAEIAMLLLFSEFMNWKLLEWMNPTPIDVTQVELSKQMGHATESLSSTNDESRFLHRFVAQPRLDHDFSSDSLTKEML